VYYYNGAQWYEQFLQVGRLYLALILLGLALLSSERLCVFGLHGAIYIFLKIKKNFAYILLFTFSKLSLVGLALDLVD